MADPDVTRYLGDGKPLDIRPANAGSITLAESLGASADRDVDFFGSPARLYRYPAAAPRESTNG